VAFINKRDYRNWCRDSRVEADQDDLGQLFHREALDMLFKEDWGSSMRNCMEVIHNNKNINVKPPPYHRTANLSTARLLAEVRFDTISPWRMAQKCRKKGDPSVTPICDLCSDEKPARAAHYFDCVHHSARGLKDRARERCRILNLPVEHISFQRVVNFHFPGITKEQQCQFAEICTDYIKEVGQLIKQVAKNLPSQPLIEEEV